MKNYYKILGVSPNASALEIKRVYRKLAVLYHPDKNSDPTAEQFFKEVNEAYDVLGDETKRVAYDFKIQNPFGEVIQPEESGPFHRDPAYHRKRRNNGQSQSRKPSKLELMREYLPYFKWMIYAGLALMIVFIIDYTLPTQVAREEVVESYAIKFMRSSYFIIKTTNHEIKIRHGGSRYFSDQNEIFVEYTPLLHAVISISTMRADHVMELGGIYSPMIFIPLLLFGVSMVGFILRNNIEYAFNISIICGILILMVVYLIFNS